MTIEETDTIDIIAARPDGTVLLVVTDHLEWGDETHLYALQEKLNSYIAFVETGQVYEQDGVTQESRIEVEVVVKHEPDATGQEFLFQVGEVMGQAGIPLSWRMGS